MNVQALGVAYNTIRSISKSRIILQSFADSGIYDVISTFVDCQDSRKELYACLIIAYATSDGGKVEVKQELPVLLCDMLRASMK